MGFAEIVKLKPARRNKSAKQNTVGTKSSDPPGVSCISPFVLLDSFILRFPYAQFRKKLFLYCTSNFGAELNGGAYPSTKPT